MLSDVAPLWQSHQQLCLGWVLSCLLVLNSFQQCFMPSSCSFPTQPPLNYSSRPWDLPLAPGCTEAANPAGSAALCWGNAGALPCVEHCAWVTARRPSPSTSPALPRAQHGGNPSWDNLRSLLHSAFSSQDSPLLEDKPIVENAFRNSSHSQN